MEYWRISSIRNKNCRGAFFAGLCLAALLTALLSICLGPVPVAPVDVLQALLGIGTKPVQTQIVLFARLPRTCGCLLAGAALALSGAVIQGVLNNPLAAPNMIGVNAGAELMVALCCGLFPTALALVPFAAFLGALAGVLLVLAIAERTGASRITLILAGIAVSSMFSAGIDAVVTFVPDALNGYSDFRIGGLANLSMARVMPAFWVILVAAVLVLSLSGELDVLLLGTETAQSLGLPAKPVRLLFLALAAALAGAAVSFAGLLGFVGLIVSHIMRRLIGEESLGLLVCSALGGAALLTLCDLLDGRVLLDHTPVETLSPRQIAQKIAYLPQSRTVPNITARRMVLHGRFPYLSYPRRYRTEDYAIADRALQWMDAADIADSPVNELSGGQRQKVYLAMALAQDTDAVLMDEPTTYLDVRHQLEVMEAARKLASQGKTVVLVLHDLCLAMRFADEIAVLSGGGVQQRGTPEEVYQSGVLDRVFGVALRRMQTGDGWQYYYV